MFALLSYSVLSAMLLAGWGCKGVLPVSPARGMQSILSVGSRLYRYAISAQSYAETFIRVVAEDRQNNAVEI